MQELITLVKRYRPNVVKIEQNFGYGALRAVFLPLLRAEYADCSVEDDYVSGQKETRIIDILEPIIARGSLVVAADAIKGEPATLTQHPDVNRMTYCLWNQLSLITRERDSLVHDDRLDALAGACAHWQEALMVDHEKARELIAQQQMDKFWKDPLGHNRYGVSNGKVVGNGHNMLAYRRGRR